MNSFVKGSELIENISCPLRLEINNIQFEDNVIRVQSKPYIITVLNIAQKKNKVKPARKFTYIHTRDT